MKADKIAKSFQCALEGIRYAIMRERNFRIHLCAAAAALVLAIILQVQAWEMLVLTLTIVMVLAAEMFNTAIEAAVDLFCGDRFHPLAKAAKDAAAGAVLVTALGACIVGYWLFFHRLAALFM